MMTLRLFFKGLQHQEINFKEGAEVWIGNFPRSCCVYLNGKPYVRFMVEADGWQIGVQGVALEPLSGPVVEGASACPVTTKR